MKNQIWHWNGRFLTKSPKEVLGTLLKDDKANYYKAEAELSSTIELLDRAIALYIEALQGAYRMLDDWKSRLNLRAAMAMAGSALNYILLARHSILLGYYPEARDLLRGCHERITRCYLFHVDNEATKRFFSGKQILQKEVDDRLAELFEHDENKKDIYDRLRKSYKSSSAVIHPNLKSLRLRTLPPEEGANFKECVGIHTTLGGVTASNFGETVILSIISTVLFALKVIGAVVVEGTGKWKDDFSRIEEEANKLLEKLKAEKTE